MLPRGAQARQGATFRTAPLVDQMWLVPIVPGHFWCHFPGLSGGIDPANGTCETTKKHRKLRRRLSLSKQLQVRLLHNDAGFTFVPAAVGRSLL